MSQSKWKLWLKRLECLMPPVLKMCSLLRRASATQMFSGPSKPVGKFVWHAATVTRQKAYVSLLAPQKLIPFGVEVSAYLTFPRGCRKSICHRALPLWGSWGRSGWTERWCGRMIGMACTSPQVDLSPCH